MLVQKFPKASQEKHLLRGFSSGASFPGRSDERSKDHCNQTVTPSNHCAASKYPASIGRESHHLLVAARSPSGSLRRFSSSTCLLRPAGCARPDEYNTLYTTESLVLRGSTAVPQAVEMHNFYGRYDLHGQPRAAYPPGQALLCAPWYAIGQYLLAPIARRARRRYRLWSWHSLRA